MKALTFEGKKDIRYQSVNDPSILQDTDVIVQVTLTAVCGSDLHIYHEHEKGLDCGTVMGHEFVGIVVETGKHITQLKKGDRVVSPFTTNCGQCYYCKMGLTCRCEYGQLYGWVAKGQGLHGAQAEYVRVPLAESTLVKLPEYISDEQALLIADVFCTGFYCADMAEITKNKAGTYAIVGCGPVGLMAVVSAKMLGAERIFAIDAVPERLQQAERYGAISINYTEQDPKTFLLNETQGYGVDAVMEAVGKSAASRTAYDIVRHGGIISTVGVHVSNQFAFSPVEAYDKNLTYKIGRCPARSYMQPLLAQLKNNALNITDIITHHFSLQEGAEAYRIFDKKKDGCLKAVLKP